MPLHLTTLPRRAFLETSLGAGAALLTLNARAADAPAQNVEHVALIADTHVDADPTKVVRGSVMASNLLRVVADILSQPTKPVMSVIDGDCAFNKGLPEDYRTLASLISGFTSANIPLNMTMGNHDDRAVFLAQFQSDDTAATAVEGKHVTLVQTQNANWFLIDTLLEVNKVTGAVGTQQLQWLKTALQAHSDRPAIVVGHHNPQFTVPASGVVTGLQDSEPLFDVLDGLRHVQAYVFGHTHNWNVSTRDSGLHLINLPPVGYVFSEARPLGWVDAEVQTGGLKLTLHSLDAGHPEHLTFRELMWRS